MGQYDIGLAWLSREGAGVIGCSAAVTAYHSIRRLFAAGEKGIWLDPSDMSTMFQDKTLTPVTAVEQSVLLILDKSHGFTYGSELVTNGDFSSSTGWTIQDSGTTTVSSGKLRFTSTANDKYIRRSLSTTAGRLYKITITLDSISAGSVRIYLHTAAWTYGVSTAILSNSGTFISYVVAPGNTDLVSIYTVGTTTCVIDSISVTEVTAGYVSASSDAKRPVLSARYNLLTKTEDFSVSPWAVATSGMTRTPGQLYDPDGTYIATKIDQGANGGYILCTLTGLVGGTQKRLSVCAKADNATRFEMYLGGGSDCVIRFSLIDGSFISKHTSISAYSSVSLGNGWYLFSMTAENNSSTQPLFSFLSNTNSLINQSGWITKADFRYLNDGVNLPPYQRVNTATDYDTVGFPKYLKFSGGQCLVTPSIDFSGTDKMTVWAGVRKLSDAAQSVVCELSASTASNNGSFAIKAPDSNAANTYLFQSKGTTLTDAQKISVVAPCTHVLQASGDISGDSTKLIVNAVQAENDTGDQGTGNYGNYALYIGSRGDLASLPLTGRLYSLIIRGAASSTATINRINQYVNGRTRAY